MKRTAPCSSLAIRSSRLAFVLTTMLAVAAMMTSKVTYAVGTSSSSLTLDRVSLDLVADSPASAPGNTFNLAVIMSIEPGWHIYPGKGSADEVPGYIPTEIDVTAPSGWTVGEIEWPEAHDFVFAGEELKSLDGEAIAFIPITIAADAGTDTDQEITVELGYQACDDRICEMPTSTSAATSIRIASTDQIDTVKDDRDALRKRIFDGRDSSGEIATKEPPSSPQQKPDPGNAPPSGRVNISLSVADGTTTLATRMDIQNTWHITPGVGSGEEYNLPTELTFDFPEGWSHSEIRWPESHQIEIIGPDGPEFLPAYEGVQSAHVDLTIPDSTEPGTYNITAELNYQACDPEVCEPPAIATAGLTINLERKTDDGSLRIASTQALSAGDPPTPNPASTDSTSAINVTTGESNQVARPTFFGITVPRADGAFGFILLAIASAIGGFVLNLTPCVLPVIPIKIMTIMQHANKPGRNLILGLWMALGVVAFWVGIGLPVAFVSGVTDPSRIFGIWWVTLGIGLLIAFMGIGIMGMFTLQLPDSVYAINPKADTAWGSFVFGVMTAVLGLPCFGFVAGALLAGSATMPPATIMTIFTSLGIGMAAPYLVLSMKPGLIERIPRTGPASELVKQVMGLLLLAAAAYFVGSGLIALVSEKPYIARQLHIWAVAIFAVLAGLWLIVRTFQITSRPAPRVSFLLVGVIVGALATLYAYDATGKARKDWEAVQAALAASDGGGYIHGAWNKWSRAAVAKARADGNIVVLDFTAEWCINCKLLKATVLNPEPVGSALNADDVVKFTVDLTSTSAPGWKRLQELGQTGIPLLAIYAPDDVEPWQSNAYTAQQVLDALDAARNRRMASSRQ